MANPFDPYKPPAASLDGPAVSSGAPAGVSEGVVQVLAQTRPWVKLFSILTFVALAIFILLFVVIVVVRMGGASAPKPFPLLPMILVLMLYIPPALFLWKYADGIRQVQAGGGMPALESALRQQKSFWKYVGIFALVMLAIYALFFGFGLLFGFFKGAAGD